ncbi:MAG: outer membrane beta-barrel protein [Bacteroidales bacterium]|nr:outer membrane beta-barrel protein [Bacteroidales bacterium]MCD8393967.1 outer membrane beta-barrel protein [Bacteroidales bacterium]
MKIQHLLLAALLACATPLAEAQTNSSNYCTEASTVLVKEANDLFNKKKYAEAKVLYERALATGDKFVESKCTSQLRVINTLLASEKKSAPTTVFAVSQDTVFINYLGGDYPIHVSGNNWSATKSDNQDWCKIEVDRKKGLIMIVSSPNETTEDRGTTITVRNGNGQSKTVRVTNGASPEILRSSAQSLVFTPDGETSVVDIDANTAWSIADVPDWLKAIKGTNDIQFTAKANDENRDRVAQVRVETPTKHEITINIIQGAALDSLAFSKNDLTFGPDGGDEYIKVLTDADDWRFGDFPHWCQLTRVDGNTILVHCTPNEPYDMAREASINVTTGNQTLGVHVYQAPKPMLQVIPADGIGGRRISFGFSAGYLYPMIDASSSSSPTFSAVNYGIGDNTEAADYSTSGGFSIAAFADIRLYKNLYLNAGLNFLYYKYKNEWNDNFTMILPQTSSLYLKGTALGNFKEEYSMATLDIPILASYRIPVTKTSHFQINAGPVVSFGLSSKLNLSGTCNSENLYLYNIVNGTMTDNRADMHTYSSHINYDGSFNLFSKDADLTYGTSDGGNAQSQQDSSFDASPLKRVNFGLRFGVGYEYMGINLSIHYQWMVTNMANKKYWDGDRWTIFRHATDVMRGYSERHNLLLVTVGYTFRY